MNHELKLTNLGYENSSMESIEPINWNCRKNTRIEIGPNKN